MRYPRSQRLPRVQETWSDSGTGFPDRQSGTFDIATTASHTARRKSAVGLRDAREVANAR